MTGYYIWLNNTQAGPFTTAQLRELVVAGKVARNAQVIAASSFDKSKPWTNTWTSLSAVLSSGPEHESRSKEDDDEVIRFKCGNCQVWLSVKLDQICNGHRCPKCKTIYRITEQQAKPRAYLIMPVMEQKSRPEEKRDVPRSVCNSFAFFGLDPACSSDDLRTAFRHKMTQYHPDKVAHMAPEFRQVAEEKSKEINCHYDVISKWKRL